MQSLLTFRSRKNLFDVLVWEEQEVSSSRENESSTSTSSEKGVKLEKIRSDLSDLKNISWNRNHGRV